MFVGRKDELKRLEDAYDTGTFQMAVIYGRRRVGKTTLVSEFARGKRALFFTALEQADADNLADFTRVLAGFFGLPGGVRFDGWRDAFDYLCERAEQERFVFVFTSSPMRQSATERCLPSCRCVSTTGCRRRGHFLFFADQTRVSWRVTSLAARVPSTGAGPCR